MLYNSTLDRNSKVHSAQAIAVGIAADGGLFVPESIPHYDMDKLKSLQHLDYKALAKVIFRDYLDDFTDSEIADCVENAYTSDKFGSDNPTPISSCNYNGREVNILELWHGPTAAFKDMALQILPHLLTKSLRKTQGDNKAVILVATSGDTGKAALEGFKDVDGTEIIVFYPENGVSPMQLRQMNTQEGKNVNVCAIKGNFDDAQRGVKTIFTDSEIIARLRENNMLFSSANSINWGRLLPQIVYYFHAYFSLVRSEKIKLGDKVNITVPTGNFGNILASYYACMMGLPVNRFICASNSNNVLTDFIETGVYDRNRKFYTTASPSMDILISSNLERFLYHISGEDDKKIAYWMQQLKSTGKYEVSEDVKTKIKTCFFGGYCDDEGTKRTIKRMYDESGYLCDTHTAVAVDVYDKYVQKTGDDTPVIIASTASPYKFCRSVLEALGKPNTDDEFEMVSILSELTSTVPPTAISGLKDKKQRFNSSVEPDSMAEFITAHLGV